MLLLPYFESIIGDVTLFVEQLITSYNVLAFDSTMNQKAQP